MMQLLGMSLGSGCRTADSDGVSGNRTYVRDRGRQCGAIDVRRDRIGSRERGDENGDDTAIVSLDGVVNRANSATGLLR